MKLNVGIITPKLKETKAFYVDKLGFGVTFENDWFLLLHTPNQQYEISFLLPKQESQAPLFQTAFANKGIFLTIEVDDIDGLYKKIQNKGISIEVAIKDEPWGDRHFAIVDPNGVGIDFVRYDKPSEA